MNEFNGKSFLPKQMQVLSGSALKVIAMLTMLIDHTGAIILAYYGPAKQVLFRIDKYAYTAYSISRSIGRIAFPIFCFLLVEGFLHTHNRWKYGRNLLIFALISEVPWDLWHSGTYFSMSKQNVYFTLFLGYLAFCLLEYFWEKPLIQLGGVLVLLGVSYYLRADYGWKGYAFLLIMYFLRNERLYQAIVGSCWLSYEWKACFAYIFINMYNGERGFIKGKLKYIFYWFYPVHIMILYSIRIWMMTARH